MRELSSRIDETFKLRASSDSHFNLWEVACDQLHSNYDSLAFPGGLEQGLKEIKDEDLRTIEVALCYLEETPYCFRSQYVATQLKRALNKISLASMSQERFHNWKNKRQNKTLHPIADHVGEASKHDHYNLKSKWKVHWVSDRCALRSVKKRRFHLDEHSNEH